MPACTIQVPTCVYFARVANMLTTSDRWPSLSLRCDEVSRTFPMDAPMSLRLGASQDVVDMQRQS